MSYLYVEPYEVRHEVLTRIKDLTSWTDVGLAASGRIGPEDWPALKERVGRFLSETNPLEIDGQPARPILDRWSITSSRPMVRSARNGESPSPMSKNCGHAFSKC